ncbi:MAG: hypothetical protein JSS64_02430 [Bacteroidetes bacterium]|nr:hypothetical protein [Bacteroidota bacterium]
MNTLVITPKNKTQYSKLLKFAEELGVAVSQMSAEDKEDAALLRAMMDSEKKSKKNVSVATFFKTLAS